jgi:hypothetical protein
VKTAGRRRSRSRPRRRPRAPDRSGGRTRTGMPPLWLEADRGPELGADGRRRPVRRARCVALAVAKAAAKALGQKNDKVACPARFHVTFRHLASGRTLRTKVHATPPRLCQVLDVRPQSRPHAHLGLAVRFARPLPRLDAIEDQLVQQIAKALIPAVDKGRIASAPDGGVGLDCLVRLVDVKKAPALRGPSQQPNLSGRGRSAP